MLRSAPSKVKHGARSCLGIGDVFLITKESDSNTVEKYKNMAVSEKARADENADEIHELREMLNGARGGSAELEELNRALDDRTEKLREAEEARRASQAAAQAAIEESLQDAASLREQLAKAEEELEAERKRAKLATEQLAEEQASKVAVATGSEAAAAMVTKLQAELSSAQVDLNEEKLRIAAADNQLSQTKAKLAEESAALAALQGLAEQEQKKQAELASAAAAQIAKLQAEIAQMRAEQQQKESGLAAQMAKLQADAAHLKAELVDAKSSQSVDTADSMAAASALAMLQREMDGVNAKLASEKAAHLATEEARKAAMADLANLREASAADPRKNQAEAEMRLQELLLNSRIVFDGAGSQTTQQSARGVPQAWSLDSLQADRATANADTIDQLAAVLKDYPELYCECQGKTDADPTKEPEAGLARFFALDSTQAIQDELARNRALACKEGLVARGVPDEQLVVTWEGCGSESGVNFRPLLSADALQMLRSEVALLREKLARAELEKSPPLVDRTAAALERVQELLKGNAIQFDGAGAKATQASEIGVPQAWSLDSLDEAKKGKNAATLDQLAAILKDYPELSCNLHGSTDADPAKQPDAGLAAFFKQDSTQAIQDELARNRALACKEGLVARGVPVTRLVTTWKGCGEQSKVDFTPMLPGDALGEEVAMLREMLAQAAKAATVSAANSEALTTALTAAQAEAAASAAAQAAAESAAQAAAQAAEQAAGEAKALDPKLRVVEALERVQELLKGNAIQFDGAGAKATQASEIGVPQAWRVDSLDEGKKGKNAATLDQLAAILMDYPELSCVLHGSTDADPAKQPDAVLAAHFALDSTQAIQDELARNRALACKEGLVARGVPGTQLVVTWKGCGEESKVDFTPMLTRDAMAAAELQAQAELAALGSRLAALQEQLASKAQGSDADHAELASARRALANSQAALANAQAALADAQASDPHKDAAAAAKRMQEVLAGEAIQFDGAGNKATQQSARGVPQGWSLDTLDESKKAINANILDLLAAILKDYPDLYCECHGSTDADPTKQPDAGLAAYFKLDKTKAIQDELARNRALACKEGLVARGVPEPQLVITWKGCGGASKVSFTPLVPPAALKAVRAKMFEQRDALTAEIAQLKGLLDKGAPPKAEAAPPAPKVRAPAGAPPRKVDQFGVLRVCVQSASGLKAADKGGTSDPYAKLYLGEHVLHRTSHMSRTLDPVWNENFEFHGNLKTLLADKLKVQVCDYDAGGKNLGHSQAAAAENDLGVAAFDLSDVQTADFEGEAQLSVQGSIKMKFSWAPAKVLKKGDMFVKHKGDVVTSMGKYVKNEFTLWYAENNGRSGGSHAAWKSYRMAYVDKGGAQNYHTVLGVEAETVTRYEFSISTLEHGTMAMRCESKADFTEWTALIKNVEDPKLTFHRKSVVATGLRRLSALGGGSSPNLKK